MALHDGLPEQLINIVGKQLALRSPKIKQQSPKTKQQRQEPVQFHVSLTFSLLALVIYN